MKITAKLNAYTDGRVIMITVEGALPFPALAGNSYLSCLRNRLRRRYNERLLRKLVARAAVRVLGGRQLWTDAGF